MIDRFGYTGWLSAPISLIEAHEMQWLAYQAAKNDNEREGAPK